MMLLAENYRGWYGGIKAGATNRNVDFKVKMNDPDVDDFLQKISWDLKQKNVLNVFNNHIMLGLGNTGFFEGNLGYSWRIKNFWIGVNGVLFYEPRRINLWVHTAVEESDSERHLFRAKVSHILLYGLDLQLEEKAIKPAQNNIIFILMITKILESLLYKIHLLAILIATFWEENYDIVSIEI